MKELLSHRKLKMMRLMRRSKILMTMRRPRRSKNHLLKERFRMGQTRREDQREVKLRRRKV